MKSLSMRTPTPATTTQSTAPLVSAVNLDLPPTRSRSASQDAITGQSRTPSRPRALSDLPNAISSISHQQTTAPTPAPAQVSQQQPAFAASYTIPHKVCLYIVHLCPTDVLLACTAS